MRFVPETPSSPSPPEELYLKITFKDLRWSSWKGFILEDENTESCKINLLEGWKGEHGREFILKSPTLLEKLKTGVGAGILLSLFL